jgi:hypothetical protein
MKTTNLIIILLSVYTLSLNCEPNSQDQIHNNSETIIKKFIKFANSGNLDMIDELFAENCIYEDVPDQMSYHGIDEVKSFLGELYEWSPDLYSKIIGLLLNGSGVVLKQETSKV